MIAIRNYMSRNQIISLVVLIISLLMFFSCNKKSSDIFTVGAILPLTGPAGQFGQFAQEGIQIGLDALSLKENLPFTIQVLYEDSQGDPKNAISILNKFTKVNKTDIIFVLTSGETLAILPIINDEKIVTITGTLMPGIADESEYLFRNATSIDQEVKYMAKFLAKKKVKPTVGILYVNNDVGIISKDSFIESYSEISGDVVREESYEPGIMDFRTQLTKIKSSNPDYLYILSYKEFGLIMKQARELGLNANFIGTTTFEDPSGVKVAGNAADGALYTISAFDPDAFNTDLIQFQKKYIEKYGRKAELYAALFRDNINILALALTSNPQNSTDLKNAILNLGIIEGASGTTKFLSNGDVEKPITLKEIRNGKFIRFKEEI